MKDKIIGVMMSGSLFIGKLEENSLVGTMANPSWVKLNDVLISIVAFGQKGPMAPMFPIGLDPGNKNISIRPDAIIWNLGSQILEQYADTQNRLKEVQENTIQTQMS